MSVNFTIGMCVAVVVFACLYFIITNRRRGGK